MPADASLPPDRAALLELRGMAKRFGGVQALRGVDFVLHAGEVHALLGENGAGKSTLIKLITGAHRADRGTITLGGETMAGLTPAEARRRGIACVYQKPGLFPDLSVAENIALRLDPSRPWRPVNWRSRRARASGLLERIGARIAADAEVGSLSMPEQQLVEIACAIGANAPVVIMDEPTACLTHREQDIVYRVTREICAAGGGVIYISHRLEEIAELADRVTVLRDGASVGTRLRAQLNAAELITLMVGRETPQVAHALHAGSPGFSRNLVPPEGGTTNSAAAVVLEARGLTSHAAGVRNVSFSVRAGEVFGLAGLVGAGRTELARVLFGLAPLDAGEIRLDGAVIAPKSPRAAVAHGIAYVPEDRLRHGVVAALPVAQNITLSILSRMFPGSWLRPRTERETALEHIRALAIKTAGPEAAASTLSGGNQQKIVLARWLATKPRLLILDEPTQGVDVGTKSEVHRIIRRLAQEGLAVILISSDLPEVLGMSDRLGVMRGGELVTVLPGGTSPETVMAAAFGQDSGVGRVSDPPSVKAAQNPAQPHE